MAEHCRPANIGWMKRATVWALWLAALLHTSIAGAAETYPSKPVRVIVPFAPGGGGDITARIVSGKLSEKLRQQVVVDNRGGAGGLIGVELGVRAQPDGYTVLIASSSFSATSATHKPKFDPVNNFAAVGEIGIAPFVLTVHPTIAANSVDRLVTLAKGSREPLIYAIPGVGSITHLATELFTHMAGVRMTGVAYKGTGPAMLDVLSGQCQLIVGSLPPVQPHLQSGKLRALGVTSTKRWYTIPQVPTIGETVPGYAVENWWGIMLPKGTPAEIISTLNTTLNEVIKDKDLLARFDREGVVPTGGTSAYFEKRVRDEYVKWLALVDRAKIKPVSD